MAGISVNTLSIAPQFDLLVSGTLFQKGIKIFQNFLKVQNTCEDAIIRSRLNCPYSLRVSFQFLNAFATSPHAHSAEVFEINECHNPPGNGRTDPRNQRQDPHWE